MFTKQQNFGCFKIGSICNNKINTTQNLMTIYFCDGRKHCGKSEICGLKILFPQHLLNLLLCGKGLMIICLSKSENSVQLLIFHFWGPECSTK